ncbi:MAG: TolB family protein [Candidatus Dormibacteria bacterium]
MAEFPSWFRRRTTPPAGVDPELFEILEEDPRGREQGLLSTAREIRDAIRTTARPEPDPVYRSHLRASLMEEAHLRSRVRSHPRRRFGFFLGTSMGVAGLAMLALVVVSVVVLPAGAKSVTVRASVQGDPRVPVTQAIQLSFNQPMVETSVVQGLKIDPAVSFRAEWPDANTLVIAPRHYLVPNVSYVVSIARSAAKAQNGATPLSNIVIPFGTVPTSSKGIGYPPSLVAVDRVAYATGAQSLSYAPDGQLLLLASGQVVSQGALLPTLPGTPAPTITSAPPSLNNPSATSALSPAAQSGVIYTLASPQAALAGNALGPVASPDSQNLAYWAPAATGSSTLEVAPIGGSGRGLALASSTDQSPQLAWLNDSELLYSSEGRLFEVNLDGQTSSVFPFVKLGAPGYFSISPNGQALFAKPAGVPTVYDLANGSARVLAGLQGTPSWSPASDQLAYVAEQDGHQVIDLSATLGGQVQQLLVAPAGTGLGGLTYSPDGSYLAYLAETPGTGSQLGAVDVATGTSALLSTLTGMSQPAWSPFGSELSALESTPTGASAVLSLQLSNPPQTSGAGGLAASAIGWASQLAQLQVTAGPAALPAMADLLAPNTSIATPLLLPGSFDRFYAVSSTPASAGASSYEVDLELVKDATASTPAAYLQEQVTVAMGGPSPLITALSQGQLTNLPAGPLVLNATSTTSAGTTTFVLQFNSDLDPATVGPQSVALTDGGQPVANLQISYQASSRQVTVTASQLPPGPLQLTVSAPLSDVNHTPISVAYQLSLPAVPTS